MQVEQAPDPKGGHVGVGLQGDKGEDVVEGLALLRVRAAGVALGALGLGEEADGADGGSRVGGRRGGGLQGEDLGPKGGVRGVLEVVGL